MEETNLQSTEMDCGDQRGCSTYCVRYLITSLFVISFTLFVIFVGRHYVKSILLWVQAQPDPIGLVIFFLLFTVVSFPMIWGYLLLNVGIGYIYGVAQGLLIVIVCATGGTLIAHIVLVRFCHNCLRTKIANYGVAAFVALVDSERGFKVIILSRLTPVPFGLQNGIFAVSSRSLITVDFINNISL